ncbi:hypothetical protein L486_01432 [Kwoniella mangroviensis CBS 10435]|uniref:Uncharacterized protein n=1 Tax=Kwoniella mangroviensis CBS 10435 TaxID=1331196 RepID=A0A1B9J1W0_9TREE|nr:uncharacterized protein I203_03902 [Kwoniella mangroviensis CBS 8507]OCF61771.1 hypothetical protein L486_01432 [Kwoniella mangroviensis CBS 10435]OCF67215.1 hypothetical protein I203_03902 [Kwoniella mangroviensis CBS 8507]
MSAPTTSVSPSSASLLALLKNKRFDPSKAYIDERTFDFDEATIGAVSRASTYFQEGSSEAKLLSNIAGQHSSILTLPDKDLYDLRGSITMGAAESKVQPSSRTASIIPSKEDFQAVIKCIDALLSGSEGEDINKRVNDDPTTMRPTF